MMTDKEKVLVEKTTAILGRDTLYMNLVEVIAELVEVIENELPNR